MARWVWLVAARRAASSARSLAARSSVAGGFFTGAVITSPLTALAGARPADEAGAGVALGDEVRSVGELSG